MTTESDRELLELAAKAAGIVGDYFAGSEKYTQGIWRDGENDDRICWNPLADDGDALRLAVKLRLHVSVFADAIGIGTPARGYEESKWTDDPYAAIRRAIVRAAAAIGAHKEGD